MVSISKFYVHSLNTITGEDRYGKEQAPLLEPEQGLDHALLKIVGVHNLEVDWDGHPQESVLSNGAQSKIIVRRHGVVKGTTIIIDVTELR